MIECLILPLVPLLLLTAPASDDLSADVTLQQDISYGSDPVQRFDVYLPPHPQNVPILFMVHGEARPWMISCAALDGL